MMQNPLKLFGTDLRITESTDEPKLLLRGALIQSSIERLIVNADWTDQGFGNTKSRLWLRLYRGDQLIHDCDLFGVCNREDPN